MCLSLYDRRAAKCYQKSFSASYSPVAAGLALGEVYMALKDEVIIRECTNTNEWIGKLKVILYSIAEWLFDDIYSSQSVSQSVEKNLRFI